MGYSVTKEALSPEENALTERIIGAAIRVHKAIGPGLLESAYQACLYYELQKSGLRVREQVPVPLVYGDVVLDVSYRLDLLVEEKVIVELKAVDSITSIHEAQLLSYLKLQDKRIGLLINFHVELLVSGVRRILNGYNSAKTSVSSVSNSVPSVVKRSRT